MKKLIALLFLVFLFSCEKKESCKICTTTVTHTTKGVLRSYSFEACGRTLELVDGKETVKVIPHGQYASDEEITKTTCK